MCPGDGGTDGGSDGGTDGSGGGGADGGPDPAFCKGGSVHVDGIAYAYPLTWGHINVCPGIPGTNICGPNFGQGGTFFANCPGTYKVCARITTDEGCNIVDGLCVDVTVATGGTTVPLPPFPGFPPTSNQCFDDIISHASQHWQWGTSLWTSLDVTGTTTNGIVINHPDIATRIDVETWVDCDNGCGGGGSGGGGGSF
jgi:hypothetical protein